MNKYNKAFALPNEVWKPIKGYKGLYEVSTMGRVKSLITGKILRPVKNKKGYLVVGLHREGKGKTFLVHRLVAQAFLPNPHNLPEINHKDQDPSNPIVGNLEWCDRKYNVNYADARKKHAASIRGRKLSESHKCKLTEVLKKYRQNIDSNTKQLIYQKISDKISKPIAMINPTTMETIRVFKSASDASQYGFTPSAISECCNGKRKSHKGFIWRYK